MKRAHWARSHLQRAWSGAESQDPSTQRACAMNFMPLPHELGGLARAAILALALAVGACGGEVAGGAAAVGALQAQQARQAKAQQDQIVNGIKDAQDAAAARAASAPEQ